MGGKEASRGFVYQGFVSVLEALTASVNWDKIYIEFPTPNDRYISHNNQMMTFEQIDLIASATIKDQMIASTHGKGIGRKEFDEDLKKRILIVADKYSTKRISIGIKSYASRGENLEEETEHCISFIDRFCDRKIKDGYDWNKDIYRDLEEFLLANTSSKFAYQIFLNTHMSMAFAAGRILNSKSGINVFPIQKTSAYGTVLWDVKPSSKRDYMNWDFTYEKLNENQRDSALVINITHNIYDNVVEYIKENNLSIGRIINCIPCGGGASKFSIEDGTHAAFLAGSVYNSIAGRSIEERRAILHIFPSAPNAFMFFLGQNSVGFGKCILYEYDFELRDSCTYSPSMKFV